MIETPRRSLTAAVWLAGLILPAAAAFGQALHPFEATSRLPTEDQLSRARFVGVGSCAAAACHGGPAQTPSRGGMINVSRVVPQPSERPAPPSPYRSEYSIWMQRDPHAGALETLRSPVSQAIADRLKLGPADKAEVCLNCHSLGRHRFDRATGDWNTVYEDVSCEACHGAAGGSLDLLTGTGGRDALAARDPRAGWLEPHKRVDWKLRSVAEKADYGFNDTKNAVALAERCARCHIGSPGRDVNHDLIAAGHPRLYFEMSAFLEKLPRHWRRNPDPRRDVELEPRLWAVGQFVAAKAAVDLLKHRAEQKDDPVAPGTAAPWPEFAENACFACHHDLTSPSWRQAGRQDPRFGESFDKPRWGSWYFALTEGLEPVLGAPSGTLAADRTALVAEMAKPFPDRARVRDTAGRLSGNLATLAHTANRDPDYTTEELHALLALLLAQPESGVTRDWEASTQVYLGLAAIAAAESQRAARSTGIATTPAAVFGDLQALRDGLRFRPAGEGVRYSSPIDFNDTRVQELSDRLAKLRANWNSR